jgi:PRTRC genetic system ThiF family protein
MLLVSDIKFIEPAVKIFPYVDEGLNIILIGAGGNGGYLVPNIMRIISTMGVLRSRIEFKVVDFDTVEDKNISRQLFVTQDIGENKASVLVKRYARAFGVPPECAGYIPNKLTSPDQMYKVMSKLYTNVIIDCVDNTTARNVMYTAFINGCRKRISGADYLISSGTGQWSGQVGVGGYNYNKDGSLAQYIPTVYATYPDMINPEKDKEEQELSCEERAFRNVQSINANIMASSLILNYLMPLFTALEACARPSATELKPWTSGIVNFNVANNSFSQTLITSDYIKKLNPAPHPIPEVPENVSTRI